MRKNAFYFILKALFVFQIFKFLFCLFGHERKRFDKKAKVNFKIYLGNKQLQHTYCQISQKLEEIRQ